MSLHKQIDFVFCFSIAGIALTAMIGAGMQHGVFAPLGAMLLVAALLGVVVLLVRTAHQASQAARQKGPNAKRKAPDRTRFLSSQIVIRTRLRCPYCHDSLLGEISECSGCKATFHDECLIEARGCVTLGCHNRAPKRTVHA